MDSLESKLVKIRLKIKKEEKQERTLRDEIYRALAGVLNENYPSKTLINLVPDFYLSKKAIYIKVANKTVANHLFLKKDLLLERLGKKVNELVFL
jgi:hypothetical protein